MSPPTGNDGDGDGEGDACTTAGEVGMGLGVGTTDRMSASVLVRVFSTLLSGPDGVGDGAGVGDDPPWREEPPGWRWWWPPAPDSGLDPAGGETASARRSRTAGTLVTRPAGRVCSKTASAATAELVCTPSRCSTTPHDPPATRHATAWR